MARKDWKKQMETKIMVIYTNPKRFPDNITVQYNEVNKYWWVTDGRKVIGKYRNKAKAIKFANAYMRRH